MQLSFFKSIKNVIGTQEMLSFDDSRDCFTKFRILANKEDGRLYSPALYNGSPQRADCNVVAMSCIVIDVDNDKWVVKNGKKEKVPSPSPTLPEDHEMNLGDIAYFWHSTHSNTADWPKFRYILMLSRDILPCEWQACFEGAYRMFGGDENIDSSCKDLSRSYYLPSCPKEHEAAKFAGYHDGELLDPDWLIEQSGMMVDYAEPQKAAVSRVGGKVEGRNNTLKGIVSACLERGEAFEKIVTEVMLADSRHGTPLFSDPAETQYAGIDPINNACLFVARIAASHSKSASRKGVKPDVPHIRTDSAYKVPEFVEVDRSIIPTTTETLPAELFPAGGLIGAIFNWIESTAIKSQPILSLAASIAAAGCLMGRKVQTVTGLRTNMLIVGLGETSCGKDHARQKVKEMFVKCGVPEMIGAEELASDAGLLTAVAKSPAILFQLDEFGRMLKSIATDSKSFKADIPSVIMKLDSSAGASFIGRAYGDKEKKREDIHQPNVCIYGTTVPGRFFSALTPCEIEDGFIPRLLVFASESPNPKKQKADVRKAGIPETVMEQVKLWVNYKEHLVGNLAGFLGSDNCQPNPRVIPFEDEAEAIFDDFEGMVHEEMDKLRSKGLSGLWGKVEAQAQRLALLHACSLNPYTDKIGADSASWGVSLVMVLTRNMVYQAGQHISSNQNEATTKKIMRDIFNAGADGITRRELHRRNRGVLAKPFRDILKGLQDDGEIYAQESGKTERWINVVFQKKEVAHGDGSGNVKQYLGSGA